MIARLLSKAEARPCRTCHPRHGSGGTVGDSRWWGERSELLQGRTSALVLTLFMVACSRPASYEQFIRAEDAPGGVYEFEIPVSLMPANSVVPSQAEESTFDISFYTAPLPEPLQLDVTWQIDAAKLDGTRRGDAAKLDVTGQSAAKQPDVTWRTAEADCQPVTVLQERVWFPAGEHRALYRSTVSFSASAPLTAGPSPILAENGEGAAILPPTFPNSEQKRGRCQIKDSDLPQKEAKMGKVIVKPINPPQDFRGLGIIFRKNDGTR